MVFFYVLIYIILAISYLIFILIDFILDVKNKNNTLNTIKGVVIQKENHILGKFFKLEQILITVVDENNKKFFLASCSNFCLYPNNLEKVQKINLWKNYTFKYYVSRFNVPYIISFENSN